MNTSHRHPPYVTLWVALLGALGLSLIVGEIWSTKAAVAFIFVVALVKAGIVLQYYMHLTFAPRWIMLISVGALSVIAVLYIGLIPDIQMGYATISQEESDRREESSRASAPTQPEFAENSPQARGAEVFKTTCQACHQADGRGMDGQLAADFIGDPSRLAKTDAELLTSIRKGMTGSIGTMPPWGGVLDEEQTRDVLSYIRAAFGEAK